MLLKFDFHVRILFKLDAKDRNWTFYFSFPSLSLTFDTITQNHILPDSLIRERKKGTQ